MVVLLFSLAGQGSGVTTRPPDPVPIERPIGSIGEGRLRRTAAWWQTP
jgi:hypothetical protein